MAKNLFSAKILPYSIDFSNRNLQNLNQNTGKAEEDEEEEQKLAELKLALAGMNMEGP